ncbi:MAG: indole-3-glycerol-phosphate synthase, partial [Muribaculaceae bacterium]
VNGTPGGIIAEFKRRSPSKGNIHPCADVTTVVSEYARNGAAACSILTDTCFFGGSLADLASARQCVQIPLLRKDFMVDKYQIAEAFLFGADAVLLIASLLSREEIEAMMAVAHDLGMEALVEIHSDDEIDKIPACTDLVGVNNRNLGNFSVDVQNSCNIVGRLPQQFTLIAESGISKPSDILNLRQAGYNGFLIGEAFMKHDNPGAALSSFAHSITACDNGK